MFRRFLPPSEDFLSNTLLRKSSNRGRNCLNKWVIFGLEKQNYHQFIQLYQSWWTWNSSTSEAGHRYNFSSLGTCAKVKNFLPNKACFLILLRTVFNFLNKKIAFFMLYFYISSIKTNQMWQKVHLFTDQWQFEVIYKIFCHFGIFFWDLRSRVPALYCALFWSIFIIRVRNKEFYLHSKSAMHFLSCIAIHKFCIAICIAIFFYIKLSLQTFFSLYFQLRLKATVELVLVL